MDSILVTVKSPDGPQSDDDGKGTISGKELESVVDEDLKAFEEFFCKKLGNNRLADPERAVIKTYLWYKMHPEETA